MILHILEQFDILGWVSWFHEVKSNFIINYTKMLFLLTCNGLLTAIFKLKEVFQNVLSFHF